MVKVLTMLNAFYVLVFVLFFNDASAQEVIKKSTSTRSCIPYASSIALEAYGSCRNPGIIYGFNIDSSGQYGYVPADRGQFPHAWSPDIATIERYICDRLSDTCDATFSAITACRTAFNLLSGLSGDWAVAAWNQALGVGIYEECSPDTGDDVTTTVTVTVMPSEVTVIVSGSGMSQSTSPPVTVTEQNTATITETSNEPWSNTRSPSTATVTVTTTLSISSTASTSRTRTSTSRSSLSPSSSSTQTSISSQTQTTESTTTTADQQTLPTNTAGTTSSRSAGNGSGGGSPFDPPFNSAAVKLPQTNLIEAFLVCFVLILIGMG